MATTQLVDGYWTVVDTGDEQRDYRLAEDGEPRLCVGGGSSPMPFEGV